MADSELVVNLAGDSKQFLEGLRRVKGELFKLQWWVRLATGTARHTFTYRPAIYLKFQFHRYP